MDTLITKKRRGPKPTGKGTLIGVRLQPDLLGTLDAYIKSERSGASRPEAIRYAIQEFLRGVGSLPPPHRTGEAPKPAKASKATKPEKPAPQLEKPAKSSVSDEEWWAGLSEACLLYTSPSPRDGLLS